MAFVFEYISEDSFVFNSVSFCCKAKSSSAFSLALLKRGTTTKVCDWALAKSSFL